MSEARIFVPKNDMKYYLWLTWEELCSRYDWLGEYTKKTEFKSANAHSLYFRLMQYCNDFENILHLTELGEKTWYYDSMRLEALSLAAAVENRFLSDKISLGDALTVLEIYHCKVNSFLDGHKETFYPIERGEDDAETLMPLKEVLDRYPSLFNFIRRAQNTEADIIKFTSVCSDLARQSCVQAAIQKARDDVILCYDELNNELFGILSVLKLLMRIQQISADHAIRFFRSWSLATRAHVRKCKGLPEEKNQNSLFSLYPLRERAVSEPDNHAGGTIEIPDDEPPKKLKTEFKAYRRKKHPRAKSGNNKKPQGADFTEDNDGRFITREENVDTVLSKIQRHPVAKRSAFDFNEEDIAEPDEPVLNKPKRQRKAVIGPKKRPGRPKGKSPRSEVELLTTPQKRLHPSAGSTSSSSENENHEAPTSQPASQTIPAPSTPPPALSAPATPTPPEPAPATPAPSEKKKSGEPPDPAAHDISIIFEKD